MPERLPLDGTQSQRLTYIVGQNLNTLSWYHAHSRAPHGIRLRLEVTKITPQLLPQPCLFSAASV